MEDYERRYREFEWRVPLTFNFGGDVVDAWARDPRRLALIWCNERGEERWFSFADIRQLSNPFANALRARGIGKGDRVLILLPRVPEWQIAMVGCCKLGAIPVPCISMHTERDVAFRAAHSGAAAAVTTREHSEKFSAARLRARFSVGGGTGWADFAEALAAASPDFQPVRMGADEPAVIYYTSGSTGHPKGVTHAARALYAWRLSAEYWLSLGPADRIWCTADTGWSKAGTSVLFGPWSRGAAVFFYDGPFDPQRRFALLERYRVTVFCAAASEFRRLVREDLSRWDLRALRFAVSAGETVNPELLRAWRRATGKELLEGYGQTETLMTVLNYPGMPVKPGSMGRPLPGAVVAVLDEKHRILPSGEVGVLAIRCPNPQLMLGYWNEPERTREAMAEAGGTQWFLTGDCVTSDAEGYLYYVGRGDDVINSAGYRIGPLEVENAVLEHPAVQECAAVASPDPERGEAVKTFVVLRAGVEGSAALAREIQELCKQITAPYKYPRKVEFVSELPRTPSGKVNRRLLREREFGLR